MVGRVAWFVGSVGQLGSPAVLGSLVCRQRGPAWFAGSVGQLGSLAAWEDKMVELSKAELQFLVDRRILDEELYGMERVKQRIIETIIQINRTHTLPAYGMLLVGPAGTGKSQIAYAVARILKLPWTTLDMSSINDSEQLTGSSRIYSNAKPGIIMEAFSMAGESNLVFIINISVQTTNPQLRCKMLNNRFAGDKLKYLQMLYDGHVEMNGQVVCCKNVNDGAELERTIRDLSRYQIGRAHV